MQCRWIFGGLVFLACADGSRSAEVFDGGLPCKGDESCPFGEECGPGRTCRPIAALDAQPVTCEGPEIQASPQDVIEFGAALRGTETNQYLTIRNDGCDTLHVVGLTLTEADLSSLELPEFFLEEVKLPLEVLPEAFAQIAVTYRPDDIDIDTAELAIASDDADESEILIAVTSERKGEPSLEVCVPAETGEGCLDPSIIDFDTMLWGATRAREVQLSNSGDGNRPVVILGVEVVSANPLFDVALSTMDDAKKIAAEVPFYLNPATETTLADRLSVRVTFDAEDEDSVVEGEALRVSYRRELVSDKGKKELVDDEAELPISVEIEGCAPNRWDVDGSAPGCEYACTNLGETDSCDGVDQDCDGAIDEDFRGAECGFGVCAESATCTAGVITCGEASDSDASCDALDNDCNGQTDEDYVRVSCGLGICRSESTCVSGVESCSPRSSATEVCNGLDDDCDDTTDEDYVSTICGVGACVVESECLDGSEVCTPGVPTAEICDAVDNDCDGETDDEYVPYFCGEGNCRRSSQCLAAGREACIPGPPEPEACDNEDNNCDGWVDDGCDEDGDGYCTRALETEGTPDACAAGAGDCNDDDPSIHPGAHEVCDNIDQDCDGSIDEGCDDDNDDYCDVTVAIVGTPATCQSGGGDCNDGDAAVNPGATEICDDINNDCDVDGVDEGCDDDNDNYCDAAMAIVGTPETCTAGGGDCNDTNVTVYPMGPEICDNLNNDCDVDGVDEGCDDDNDNYCDAAMALVGTPGTCWFGGGDCNDDVSAIRPGALEKCDNIDNDCEGGIDEGCDDDDDNFCDSAMVLTVASICTAGGGDCNDTDASINPRADEICDNINNDCDADGVDEGCDDDNDNYCDAAIAIVGTPTTCTSGGGDCNDDRPSVHPGVPEKCDDIDDDCDGLRDDGCDDDNDNYCDATFTVVGTPATCTAGGADCNDMNASVNPGAMDICDDINNDCDSAVDEGCDDDDDNYCDATLPIVGTPATCTAGGGDCNDGNSAIKPGLTETCDNIDNNCTGQADEGCDDDDDNTCDSTMAISGVPDTCTEGGGDCNDASAEVKPGAVEVCDSVNNDCDADGVDEGCDDDNDNYCDVAMTVVGTPVTCTAGGSDCNDADATVYPLASEICDNLNNDCDEDGADEGCDDDNDNYCDAAIAIVGTPTTCTSGGGDCNDAQSTIKPGATEKCDNVDNNCASGVDEGCDDDDDNFCDSAMVLTTSSTCTSGGGDCNDTNASINPGALEICDDTNNDCDAYVDEGCDDDNDNYCDAALPIVGTPGTCTAGGGDCNDANNAVYPTRLEICDNLNNDCDVDGVDEGCDDDNDNYCDSDMTRSGTPSTCTAGGGDCNDNDAAIQPTAPEICDNVNNDCDGNVDEGCDDDNDDYCDAAIPMVGTPATCPRGGGDCDDTHGWIRPDLAEICDDYDNNCVGGIDEGCDDDNDDYCDATMAVSGTPTTCMAGSRDCDDLDAAVHPGATELCDNVDSNCNGSMEDGCDDDGDDYCDAAMTTVGTPAVCPNGGGDCNDVWGGQNPGRPEICDNIDNNCAGGIDEGCDDDNDNYCDSAMTTSGLPDTCTGGGGDCNDTNAAIKPGAVEICDNINNDCDGAGIDEGCDDDNDDYCDAAMGIVGTPLTCSSGGGDCNDTNASIHPGAGCD